MDDKIKECLTQLEEKIAQLTKIISQLATCSTKTPVTPVAKLSPTSRDENLPSRKEDEKPTTTKSPPLQPFKLEAYIDIPIYDRTIDTKRLDNWLDRLEIYFTIYGYTSVQKVALACLKLSSHALIQ